MTPARALSRSSLPLVFATFALALGCESRVPERSAPDPGPTRGTESPAGPKVFGAALRAETPTPLAEVLARPQDFEGKLLVVEGEVRRACSKKGCWMELSTAKDEGAPSCRVTFQDYGFFVPTNSAGAVAKVDGRVELSKVPKSRVDHLEAEGAHFPSKNPDGTANEVRIVATGVELTRRS